jgi:hypothetical protein
MCFLDRRKQFWSDPITKSPLAGRALAFWHQPETKNNKQNLAQQRGNTCPARSFLADNLLLRQR